MKALVLLLLLAGCARDGTARLEAKLAPLVGRPTSELVSRLGFPDAIARRESLPGGETILTWRIVWPRHGGREFQPPATDGGARACDISFASRGGRVTGYRAVGEACGWGDLPDLLP